LSVFNISGLPEEYYHNSMDYLIFTPHNLLNINLF